MSWGRGGAGAGAGAACSNDLDSPLVIVKLATAALEHVRTARRRGKASARAGDSLLIELPAPRHELMLQAG
jgi:hypothetical protein